MVEIFGALPTDHKTFFNFGGDVQGRNCLNVVLDTLNRVLKFLLNGLRSPLPRGHRSRETQFGR
jgi:hypothetical protein